MSNLAARMHDSEHSDCSLPLQEGYRRPARDGWDFRRCHSDGTNQVDHRHNLHNAASHTVPMSQLLPNYTIDMAAYASWGGKSNLLVRQHDQPHEALSVQV